MTINEQRKAVAVAMQKYHFMIDHLVGPYQQKDRQAMMEIMTGKKLPIAKCGVNATRKAMIELFNIATEGECIAGVDKRLKLALSVWVKGYPE